MAVITRSSNKLHQAGLDEESPFKETDVNKDIICEVSDNVRSLIKFRN
jgi:hypothetical protein